MVDDDPKAAGAKAGTVGSFLTVFNGEAPNDAGGKGSLPTPIPNIAGAPGGTLAPNAAPKDSGPEAGAGGCVRFAAGLVSSLRPLAPDAGMENAGAGCFSFSFSAGLGDPPKGEEKSSADLVSKFPMEGGTNGVEGGVALSVALDTAAANEEDDGAPLFGTAAIGELFGAVGDLPCSDEVFFWPDFNTCQAPLE